MSDQNLTDPLPALAIPNEYLGSGGASRDAQLVASAIFALAREVRQVGDATHVRLYEIEKSLDLLCNATRER